MKTSKIQIVHFYDSRKVIEEYINMFMTFEDDSFTKKKEIRISDSTSILANLKQGVELIGIYSHFIQFTAFMPNYDAKQTFKKVTINCFY